MTQCNKKIFSLIVTVLLFHDYSNACWSTRKKNKLPDDITKTLVAHQITIQEPETLGSILEEALRHFRSQENTKQLIFVDYDNTLVKVDDKATHPIQPVINLCTKLKALGYTLIILSSRVKEEEFELVKKDLEFFELEDEITEIILLPFKDLRRAKENIGAWKASQRKDAALRYKLPVAGTIDDLRENLVGNPTYLGYPVHVTQAF